MSKRHFLIFPCLICQLAHSQVGTASIHGNVVDAKTLKPVPIVHVIANRSGSPLLSKRTRAGGDGSFQFTGLPAGKYTLCVQPAGDLHVDPCRWNGKTTIASVSSTQALGGIVIQLAAASLLNIEVADPLGVLNQKTKDGRNPELTLGVWGPSGLFYPATKVGKTVGMPSAAQAKVTSAGVTTYVYRLQVPLDTLLNLHFSSQDLKLGDDQGAALPSTANQQAFQQQFQHKTGDISPKTFAFSILGTAR